MKLDNSFLAASAERMSALRLVPTGLAPVTYAAVETRRGATGVTVGPAAAVEVAELPSPLQVRSSHLAEQNQVILLWKERNVVKEGWAVLWVSLRNSAVLQPGW